MSIGDAPLLKVHRRQYVLGPAEWSPDTEPAGSWCHRRLGSVVLSCCPDLRVIETRDADGAPWLLVGLALQTTPGERDPASQIGGSRTAQVPALRHDWAGRWLLVGEHAAFTDSHAQIGVLMSRDGQGRAWASSSPVLLRAICGNAWQPIRPTYQVGAEFFPPPSCSLVGASRLMPSQRLDPATGSVVACDLIPEIPAGRDPSDLLDELAARLRTAFEHVPVDDRPLWLGLSAGGDSRVIFAAALAARRSTGLDVRPFTWLAGRTKLHDRIIPQQLAARVGLEHTQIRVGPIDRSREKLILAHAGPGLSRGDAMPLLRGARLGLSGFCTGGQCFDACKSTKVGKFPAWNGDKRSLAAGMARFYRERADSFFARQYALWLDHVEQTPIDGMRYECRWPVEQSGCGWQAPKEQLYDTQLLERFAATNFGRLTSLTMALPFEMGRSRDYEPEIVRRLAPELNELPRNPKDAQLIGPARARLRWLGEAGESARKFRARAGRFRRIALIRLDDARARR